MPIYSNNRTGSMALAQVAANESYTSEDFGRILYESQLNDMAFFEAVLACDFNEIKGLREGTILESEVKAMNEASFRAIVENMQNRLRTWWAKIKGAFKVAMDNIAAYCLNDGKAFIREFDRLTKGKIEKWNGSVDNVIVYNYNDAVFKIPTFDSMRSDIEDKFMHANLEDSKVNSNAVICSVLKNNVKQDVSSIADFSTKAMRKCTEMKSLNKSNIGEFKLRLSSGKEHISVLKNIQKLAEASLNDLLNKLKSEVKDADEENHSNTARLTTLVGAYEKAVTAIVKTAIAATKSDMKSTRKAMEAAKHDIVKNFNESYIIEGFIMDAGEQLELALTSKLEVTAEQRLEIDILIDNA